EIGICYLTLRKVARIHKIPIPTTSYWQQVKAGKRPRKLPLPRCDAPPQIEIFGASKERGRLRYKLPATDISVPAPAVIRDGPLSHPFALRTEWLLTKGKRDDAGILVSEKALVNHLKVSPRILPRALRILDALFLAFSQAPFGLVWPEGNDKKLDITVLGEWF